MVRGSGHQRVDRTRPGTRCLEAGQAHRYEELAGKYRDLTRLAHDAGKQMLLPVHPGHDNSRFREGHDACVMPRRDGQTLCEM
ncbi:MAG: hypothetical protein JXQ71_13825 [Verrucomicrobia bacterium]|nr:hypothetical protein [Verrucomicrobiota bacterium]